MSDDWKMNQEKLQELREEFNLDTKKDRFIEVIGCLMAVGGMGVMALATFTICIPPVKLFVLKVVDPNWSNNLLAGAETPARTILNEWFWLFVMVVASVAMFQGMFLHPEARLRKAVQRRLFRDYTRKNGWV